jgi:hypothetical protein
MIFLHSQIFHLIVIDESRELFLNFNFENHIVKFILFNPNTYNEKLQLYRVDISNGILASEPLDFHSKSFYRKASNLFSQPYVNFL